MCGLHPVYIYIWAVFVVAGVAVAGSCTHFIIQ